MESPRSVTTETEDVSVTTETEETDRPRSDAICGWVCYPLLFSELNYDLPLVRERCVDYLDPVTLAKCWETSRMFCVVEKMPPEKKQLKVLRTEVWRRCLTGWIERDLCAKERWVKRMMRLMMGSCPMAVFVEVLRLYVFRAGMKLIPWHQPLDGHARLCAAGSYPLYEWMTRKGFDPKWTPGDVDIYFVHPYNPSVEDDVDSEDDYEVESHWGHDWSRLGQERPVSAVRKSYNDAVRLW